MDLGLDLPLTAVPEGGREIVYNIMLNNTPRLLGRFGSEKHGHRLQRILPLSPNHNVHSVCNGK